jgi:hypothetical protein
MSTNQTLLEHLRENLAKIVLISTSLVATLIGFLDLFFDLTKITFLKETPQITLLLLGLVSLWIGLEQEANFDQLDRKQEYNFNKLNGKIDSLNQFDQIMTKIDDVQILIRSGLNAQYLNTSLETLKISERLVREAESQIYILSFDLTQINLPSSQEDREAFSVYFTAIKATVRQHQNIDFRIVYSCEGSNLSPQAAGIIASAKDSFDQFGARRARFAWKQIPVGFHLLIIDDKHLLIGFPVNTQDARPSNVIRITGNSVLVKKMSKWYEEFIWTNSTLI